MTEASDRVIAIDTERPQPALRPVDRAARVVDRGPRPFSLAALVSLALSCVLAIAISLSVRPAGYLPGPQHQIIIGSLAGLIIAAILGLVSVLAPARGRLDAVIGAHTRAAIWLALTAWFPLQLVWVYFRAKATLPLTTEWIAFGYLDKRWITCLYLLGALAPMLLVVVAARLLEAGRSHPASFRSWLSELAPARSAPPAAPQPGTADAPRPGAVTAAGPRFARRPEAIWTVAGIVTALAVAYYFYGPPWNMSRNLSGIGRQETVFLGGLQAISKGHIPYLGPASVQYGPGAQLISYLFMRHVATFSVVGFRESWALYEWVGVSILFVALFLAFGYVRGLVASLMSALIYPALEQLGFQAHSYAGYFGWANPLRYAGAISLVILLPAVIKRCPAKRGLAGAAALGLVFGALSFIAQENLIGGVVGALVIAALLMLSGSAPARSVLTALAGAAAGFVLIWVPVLAYYAAKGSLGRFLYLYMLIPRAVAEGYSNTALARPSPWVTLFYLLPFLLALLALLSVVQFRPFRIAFEWSRERIVVVAVMVTTILLYQGALLRSDSSHLTGTLLFLPAMIIVIAAGLPRILGVQRRGTLVAVGTALFAASFALLPYQSVQPASIRTRLVSPYHDRQLASGQAGPASLAADRVGAGLARGKSCCQGSHWPMPDFIHLMNRIHALVGNRVAYVVDAPRGYPGLVYFVADLNEAPIPLDPWTMVMTAQQQTAWLAYFKTTVLPKTQAVITDSLIAPEAMDFLERYPKAREYQLLFGTLPYYVLLSS